MPQPNVLVVDPNPATLRRVKEALHDVGLGLIAARDAREAEERADGAEIRLILSAASLPRGNGYDLARVLRNSHPDAAILLMTGGFEVYNTDRARQAGVDGHVTKPFSPIRLRKLVEEAIGPLDRQAADEAPLDPEEDNTTPEPAPRGASYRPLSSEERVATIIPRSYQDIPLVRVDPRTVAPEIERAILEVLPEVVDGVLRQALVGSPAFREMVAASVDAAVRQRLPEIARQVIEQRLEEIETGVKKNGA